MADTADSVVALTRDLIEMESENPPGNEAGVADIIVDRLETSPIAFDVERYDVSDERPNVVATAGHGQSHVLLTGHTDVVPANAADWTEDPYTLRIDGDRLIGRGVSDMKAALAAKLAAAESYLQANPGGCRVTLAFVCDEEWDGLGTKALVDRGVDADAAIIGEPTNLQACIAQKGVVRYSLQVYGRSAHSGMPDRGASAVRGLTHALQLIQSLDEERRQNTKHPFLQPETVTTTEIEGGLGPNVVPDAASATIDWRTHPDVTEPATTDSRIDELVAKLAEAHPDLEFEWERLVFARGAAVDPESDIVQTVVDAATEAGIDCSAVGFNAATDARFLIHDAEIPTVLFGPGSIADDAHTVDESIDRSSLERTVKTYETVLETYSKRTA
jgi:succinyl-diaminopimelate desuccinylase